MQAVDRVSERVVAGVANAAADCCTPALSKRCVWYCARDANDELDRAPAGDSAVPNSVRMPSISKWGLVHKVHAKVHVPEVPIRASSVGHCDALVPAIVLARCPVRREGNASRVALG
jgi:hypothetical protein